MNTGPYNYNMLYYHTCFYVFILLCIQVLTTIICYTTIHVFMFYFIMNTGPYNYNMLYYHTCFYVFMLLCIMVLTTIICYTTMHVFMFYFIMVTGPYNYNLLHMFFSSIMCDVIIVISIAH